MLTLFQVCFYVGVGLIVLSFLFGSVFESLGIDGIDLDFDFIGLDMYLPVSPILYILFSVVFGGVGWILVDDDRSIPMILILVVAIISGMAVSTLLSVLVIRPLKKAQNTSSPNKEELIGLGAIVSEAILEEGFGEITYTFHGNSFSSPAKNIEGNHLKIGAEVVICWIEDYVFYVTPMDKAITKDKK